MIHCEKVETENKMHKQRNEQWNTASNKIRKRREKHSSGRGIVMVAPAVATNKRNKAFTDKSIGVEVAGTACNYDGMSR